ncbi:hypothetical protein [Pseudomonas sp.]|uniref:tetratricopeptide repeat protein n=1 Tax=Pseudomonas sp. TaxID=306 RepID=UPI00290F373C|nr:hypothetical protein [Pseudomonas sp.]MDU4251703.1 hypothetical protein [Pseudomonas sp.]
MQKYWFWFVPFAALLGVAFLYWPVTSLGYVWDDTTLFLDSQLLRNPQSLWISISTQLLAGTSYFRPVVLLSFITEFKLFGVKPSVSHAVSYGLFLLNCGMVGLLAWRLSAEQPNPGRSLRASVAVLLYGCNPVLLESAAWVSARFDLMVTTFVLLGCILLISTRGFLRSCLVTLCFLLALGSKEMAITFPAIAVIWLWLERPGAVTVQDRLEVLLERQNVILVFLFAALCIAYLATRYVLFSGLYTADSLLDGSSFFTRAAFVGQTFWFYIHMAFWPFADLSPMHPFDSLQMSVGQKLAGILAVVALPIFILVLTIQGKRVGLLLLAAIFSLLPVMNIAPLMISGNIGQDRFMTLPVAFLALAISQLHVPHGGLSEAMRRMLPWMSGVLGCFWLLLGVLNIHLNTPLWGQEESLWSWAYEKAPDFESVRFNYVAALVYQNPDKAVLVLEQMESSPQGLSRRLKGMKGQLLARQGRYKEALTMLDAGLVGELQPHEQIIRKGLDLKYASITTNGFSGSWYLRFVYGAKAEAYLYLGEYDKLENSLDIMSFYDSNYPVIPLYRSFSAYAQGRIAEGDKFFAKSLSLFVESRAAAAYAARADFINRFCKMKPEQAVCQEKERFLALRGA